MKDKSKEKRGWERLNIFLKNIIINCFETTKINKNDAENGTIFIKISLFTVLNAWQYSLKKKRPKTPI